MTDYQGTFKRCEEKYLLNLNQYTALMPALLQYFKTDSYGKTQISNIYYDTPTHYLIRNSLEKPIYKEKLRLRCYGTVTPKANAFIELKKKYKGVVYKRRTCMPYTQAANFLSNNSTDLCDQILKEIEYFLSFYSDIRPSMAIYYERVAMYCKSDLNLRITFDNNILWRNSNLDLTSQIYGTPLLNKNQILMEIKIPGAMPVWLSTLLSSLNIFPCSFSKYGNAYKQAFFKTNNLNEVTFCA